MKGLLEIERGDWLTNIITTKKKTKKRAGLISCSLLWCSFIILRSEMVPDTLFGVPEMMDTPPIQNNNDFILFIFYLDWTEQLD